MSQPVDLDKLKQHRDALLLAEVAALLHDVGKLSSQFIDQMSADPSSLSQGFEHESAITQRDFVNAQFVDVLKQRALRDKLRLSGISNNEQLGQPLDLILHHDKARHSAFLVRLLNRCDGSDSGADKGTTRQVGLPKETKQQSANTFIATAFGYETQKIDPPGLDKVRVDLTSKLGGQLSNITSQRSAMLEQVKPVYAHSLAETRRSANDVTLWCHSFSVATLYKTSLATFLLNGALDIDHLRWRLLRVNFDVLGLYAKAVKIADLLGYRRAVDEACERVKQLVEEAYPLGNEVYRDTTGIYFTFPDLDLPADLAQEIRRRVEGIELELSPRVAVTIGDGATATEQLKGILAQARREALQALAQPFDMQNLSTCWQQQWETVGEGKWEVCPVCRLRPMWEGREACAHCESRRGSRIADWQATPRRTIWMDELADANGRVALLVGKFGLDDWLSGDLVQTMLVKADPATNTFTPKNPSPARLRRVWETCQRFWAETVQGLLDALPGRQRWLLQVASQDTLPPDDVVCDGTLNGDPISVWRIEDALLTVSFMPEEPKPGTLSLSWEQDGRKKQATYQVRQVSRPCAEYLCYHPTLTLLASPDQFLALLPAADALVIADRIREEYEKQFGKVQNRLPLFLGLVFFPRKMPLVAVMDAARRMLETPLGEETWTLAQDVVNGQVTFTNGEQWGVPVMMGDGCTPDEWYPYWFVTQVDFSRHPRRFQLRRQGDNDPQKIGTVSDAYADRWLVHVNDLKQSDQVFVTPSRFAYLWLEHIAQRFVFDLQRDPLLLAELPRLIKMWDAIKASGITITGLRNVQALLEAKSAAWGIASDEFRHLVETTLQEAGLFRRKGPNGNPLPDVVALEDVISGRFFRCLELYLHILKQKI